MLMIGSIIDTIFLTIYYHKKKEISKYYLLVFLFTSLIMSMNLLIIGIYRPLITLIAIIIVIFNWTRDKYSLSYICIFSLISFFLVDMPIFYILGNSDKGFVAANLLKMFLIITINDEHNHNIKFNFLNITLKMFFVIFCFLTVVGGYIVVIGRR